MIELIRKVLAQRVGQYYLFLALAVVIPLISLIGLGYLFLWEKGWALWFSLGLLGLALLTLLLRYSLFRETELHSQPVEENPAAVHLQAIADWSNRDLQVWNCALDNITRLELHSIDWAELPNAMLDQLGYVAGKYNQNVQNAKYAFTVPEVLLMLEVCSREYRGQVLSNFPLAQDIKVSTMMGVSATSTKVFSLYRAYSPFIDAARAILTGGSSLPAQVASKLGSDFGKGLTSHMQRNLKQLLFEQVSQVAIDLYSGRLKLSEDELAKYRQTLSEVTDTPVRPLSVMVVGQVNAGKSSLINALKERSVAEVDVLPATAGFHRYQVTLSEELDLTLIDSPGLDGSVGVTSRLLEEASRADLLLWISQADQPAKALDEELMSQWNEYFGTHIGRKKPPVLLVTTHNDMLKPMHSWNPPYDLNNLTDRKAQSIAAASRYTRQVLGLADDSPVVPVAFKPGAKPYNIDALRDILIDLSSEARAAQLNRERLDSAGTVAIISKTLSQTVGLAEEGVKLIFR